MYGEEGGLYREGERDVWGRGMNVWEDGGLYGEGERDVCGGGRSILGYLGYLNVLTKEDSEVGLTADQPYGEGWALEELSHPGSKRRRIAS